MGIPGSSSSQATAFDGFPLKKDKQHVLISGFFFIIIWWNRWRCLPYFFHLGHETDCSDVPIAGTDGRDLVFRWWDCVASCAEGLAAAGLGMMIAMIGEGPFNGEPRLTSYDYPYFLDGLKLVIVGFCIFAVPEIIALLRKASQ